MYLFLSILQFTPYLPTENKFDVESNPGLGKVELNYIRDHKVQKNLSLLLFIFWGQYHGSGNGEEL